MAKKFFDSLRWEDCTCKTAHGASGSRYIITCSFRISSKKTEAWLEPNYIYHWLWTIGGTSDNYKLSSIVIFALICNRWFIINVTGSMLHIFTFQLLFRLSMKQQYTQFLRKGPQPTDSCQMGKLTSGRRIQTSDLRVQTPRPCLLGHCCQQWVNPRGNAVPGRPVDELSNLTAYVRCRKMQIISLISI